MGKALVMSLTGLAQRGPGNEDSTPNKDASKHGPAHEDGK